MDKSFNNSKSSNIQSADTKQEIVEFFRKNLLFEGLTDSELQIVADMAEVRIVEPSQYIVKEEDKECDEIFLIQSGEVEILKKSTDMEHAITHLAAGDMIGELAFLEGSKRTASARAITRTTLLVWTFQEIKQLTSYESQYNEIVKRLRELQEKLANPPIFARLSFNLARGLGKRLLNTNVVTANALREELKISQLRIASARFLFAAITVIAIYAYLMSLIKASISFLSSSTVVAIPMMLIFVSLIIYFMFTSGYPMSFYGLTLRNWKRSAAEALLWSIGLMIAVVIIKWMIVHIFALGVPIFEGPGKGFKNLTPPMMIFFILMYLIMTPLQEMVVRGGIQSSLRQFAVNKNPDASAIIVSNLIFGMAHLHLSFSTALFVFVFGIVWGILYAKQKTLVGVSLSHLIVGGWAFYVVGISELLQF